MKIGLVSSLMRDNNLEYQLKQIEYYVINNISCDMLCFGESFLQGFEGLTWDYDEDIKRALSKNDCSIIRIRKLAKEYNCAISFGFIEKEDNIIYSSNMVIDKNGEVIDLFRRVSEGWKEPIATCMYREGDSFHTFTFMNKKIGVAICGDVWYDCNLEKLQDMNMDVLLWPLYVEYDVDEWNESIQTEYVERVQSLQYPVLMINSYVEDVHRAYGGCYAFYKNKTINSLPMGNIGVLEFYFN